MLGALTQYKSFIVHKVKHEFLQEYMGSALGLVWCVLKPLSIILMYTLVFSRLMHNRVHGMHGSFSYAVYLCAAVLPWNFFQDTIFNMQSMFVDNAQIIKKVNFPTATLPIIALSKNLLNFAIVYTLYVVFLALVGQFPTHAFFALFPVLILQLLFTIALGTFLATVNVFFRDVSQFMVIFMQYWFWLTPIIYPYAILPEKAKFLLQFNPMLPIVRGYQAIFVYNKMPNWTALAGFAVLTIVMLLLSLYTYKKLAGEMVDQL